MSTSGPDPRWRVLRELLERALVLEVADRDTFLVDACGDDAALLAEARALCGEDGRFDVLPEPPQGELLGTSGTDADEEPAGRRVGPYELKRLVGRGGMGAVYLAARADGEFRQRVAVKLLRGGDGPDIAARFRRERQVLANLEHPSVARLIDGGVDERGTPYLAMEYVEGVRIDTWCDEARATLRRRLELFRQVCDAVSHAHRALIVHRDLKPSNILVTAEGRPKLLDFGVAKVLDREKADDDPELTIGGLGFFTPAYASPEQVRGRPVTAASDVYSLGVLLYQLLTGRMPYAVETTSATAIIEAVCDAEPKPPSVAVTADDGATDTAERRAAARATTPSALARRLRGDLDTIVAKALRKEPLRRYASAEQLSNDVGRHLAGLPVEARPDTFAYRASRFVARNRVAVAAGALAFAGLGIGLAVALERSRAADDAYRAEARERARADQRALDLSALAADLEAARDDARAKADALGERTSELEEQTRLARERLDQVRAFATELIFDLHRELHPLEGSARAKALVLDMGLRYLDEIAKDGGDDPELLRNLSGGYLRLGQVRGDPNAANLGDPAEALAIYAKARELADRAFALDASHASAFQVAQACLIEGDLLAAMGRIEAAHESFDRGLAVEDELLAGDDPPPGNLYFAFLLRDRAAIGAMRFGDVDAAQANVDAAREHLDAAIGRMPQLANDRYVPLSRGAEIAAAAGRFEDAAELREQAVDALASVVNAAPGNAALARALREQRMDLGDSLAFVGRVERALDEVDAVARELERLHERHPDDAQAARDLADALLARARHRLALADAEGAVADAERSLDMGFDEGDALPARALAQRLTVAGRAFQAVGRKSAARDALVEAVEMLAEHEDRVAGDPMLLEQILTTYRALAQINLDQARSLDPGATWRDELLSEAQRMLRAALALYEAHESELATPLLVAGAVREDLERLAAE